MRRTYANSCRKRPLYTCSGHKETYVYIHRSCCSVLQRVAACCSVLQRVADECFMSNATYTYICSNIFLYFDILQQNPFYVKRNQCIHQCTHIYFKRDLCDLCINNQCTHIYFKRDLCIHIHQCIHVYTTNVYTFISKETYVYIFTSRARVDAQRVLWRLCVLIHFKRDVCIHIHVKRDPCRHIHVRWDLCVHVHVVTCACWRSACALAALYTHSFQKRPMYTYSCQKRRMCTYSCSHLRVSTLGVCFGGCEFGQLRLCVVQLLFV